MNSSSVNEPTVQVRSEAMEPLASTGLVHVFHATAFVENLSLKDLAIGLPGGPPPPP